MPDLELPHKRGPLGGLVVVEMASIGAGPFAAMMLADLGATVVRIDRPGGAYEHAVPGFGPDPMARGRRSLGIDIKQPGAVEVCLRIIERADALIEGYRPGVMERLGLGPEICIARNPRLAYGRATGWGQTGPLAEAAGHDINYVALSGALNTIGPQDGPPTPPLNLVGDFGGGGMLLAVGLLAAIHCARSKGRGQVVDAAMTDGSALLMTMIYGWHSAGQWQDRRGANSLDGSCYYYGSYRTADDKYIAVGALEPHFYQEFIRRGELEADTFGRQQTSPEQWPAMRELLATEIRKHTQAEWCRRLEGTDACFAPVLCLKDAPLHPHNVARGTFIDVGGQIQPAPAPRFDRTPCDVPAAPSGPGAHTEGVLAAFQFSEDEIRDLLARRVAFNEAMPLGSPGASDGSSGVQTHDR
jgi:alpha-methylacyl-CoA racemase